MRQGVFVISLDFELMWGVSDKRTIQDYGENIANGKEAIMALLDLMTDYGIRASFASVGLLYGRSIESLRGADYTPAIKPSYVFEGYSNYNHLESISLNEEDFLTYYSAPDLLRLIYEQGQDIECHTFSHYYCLEPGQTTEQFDADLKLFGKVNSLSRSRAIVFPRNQYSSDYLDVCYENGFKVFRGNELDLFHRSGAQRDNLLWRRAVRLLDSYMNITGYHCYEPEWESQLLNVRSSRFFRPPTSYKLVEFLKMKRIKNAMTYAAKTNTIFHLWWHPHNMGGNVDLFLTQLEDLFKHYTRLSKKYEMKSMSMFDVYKSLTI